MHNAAIDTPTAMPAIAPLLRRELLEVCVEAAGETFGLDEAFSEGVAVTVLTCVITDLGKSVSLVKREMAKYKWIVRWSSDGRECRCRGRKQSAGISNICTALPCWRQP